jgi:colanic acid/amylovoran biosynthesis protein
MNILITNFHSIKNKGDLGIVLGLIGGLKAVNRRFRFSVIGRNINDRGWWESSGVEFFLPLLDLPKFNQGKWFYSLTNKAGAIFFFGKYYISLALLNFPRLAYWYYSGSGEALKTLDAYKKCDVIISKGGSFFREPECRINILPVGIMSHLHQLIVGAKFKKNVILSAQSFGPINNLYSKFIMRRAMRRFPLITVRETDSMSFLKNQLSLYKNVILTGDSAFLLKMSDEGSGKNKAFYGAIEDKKNGHICVGLTVRSWSKKKDFQVYISSLISFINEYTLRGFRFYLMPQSVGPSFSEDDRIISKKIYNALDDNAKARVRIIEDELEMDDLLRLYSKMDYFIATRLHSSIFALLGGVSVMAIGYEPKTAGIFKDLDLSQLILDIRRFSPEILRDAFENLINTPKLTFLSARSKAIMLSKKNIEVILNIININ